MSSSIRMDTDGTVTVRNGIDVQSMHITQLYQKLEFMEILEHLITTDPDKFVADPIGCIAKINEQVTFKG